MTRTLHLAVALDGAGWHPAAWRHPAARPADVFTPGYWVDLVATAERAGIDFVTIEDSFSPHPRFGGAGAGAGAGDGGDRVTGRLDALLVASYLAPLTTRIGLVPAVSVTHTEPFHVATALQTLDFASEGRAGWRVQVSATPADAALFGRRVIEPIDLDAYRRGEVQTVIRDLFDEAGDVIEVVRRIWDSWEDDAIIRDVGSGRFLDGSKVHYPDFEGRFFSVKGASITPRSPQGQPPVTALAHATIPYELAAEHADIVYITPQSPEHLAEILAEVRDAERRLRPEGWPALLVYADLLVLLEGNAEDAVAALSALDDLAGAPLASDALVVAGTPTALAERLLDGQRRGLDGFRLRPARLPVDLDAIAREVVPLLEAAGVRDVIGVGGEVGADGGAATLREVLGFERPASRYAGATADIAEDVAADPRSVSTGSGVRA
ncbi:LLM class flavin-dependent oxidoreductase [Plantibacter sp. Mn2098]|uniref:LLM class flavin-dependent oxidoreductase n=1 Tax=Plantibacter sp. Mn2098 TaxID=3395266 RepID=UPI003BC59706